ncbi:hypothetical protein JCM11251_006082 [Rhodosporidiobolus azoricus]
MADAAPSQSVEAAGRPPQELIVLAGVVGSGKSSLSERWIEVVPGWARVNQDDLGDRRTCENAVRSSLRQGLSVIVDRQNFDAGQRRTWIEIGDEFEGVQVSGMVLGTSKEECRERLLKREKHPTIDNPQLAISLLDKFSGLWEEPKLEEGFDHLLTLPALPVPNLIDFALVCSLLSQLHVSPRNTSAREQRKRRPRPEPYRRPDGFVDDGTWRPPPPSMRGAGGYASEVYGGAGSGHGNPGGGGNGGGGYGHYGGNAGGSGYGYRPPAQSAYSGGVHQPGWHEQQPHYSQQSYQPHQSQRWGGGAGGYGQGGEAGRGAGGWQNGGQAPQQQQQQQHNWGGAGQRLGGPGP